MPRRSSRRKRNKSAERKRRQEPADDAKREPAEEQSQSPNPPSAGIIKDKKLRVLFLHGLESSIHGRKAKYLMERYEHCMCVDLQTSLWNPFRANCLAKYLIVGNIKLQIGVVVMLVAISVFKFAGVSLLNGMLIVSLLMAPALFLLWNGWPEMVSKATYSMMEFSLEKTEKAVRSFRPDVIVGSSFGGAVAVFALLSHFYTGPTVLLCPAHAEVNRRMAFHWKGSHVLPDDARIVIAHGTKDKTVSIEDSRQLSASDERVRLHEIKGDFHRLRSLIGQGSINSPVDLVSLIDEVMGM